MQRREVLKSLSAAAALSLIPGEARAAWARVASGMRPRSGFTDAQLAVLRAVADSIIPRTDSPGATDVGVERFVEVIVAENYRDEERASFLAGLDRIDATTMSERGRSFAQLDQPARDAVLDAIEAGPRSEEPNRTYWRLKGLVIHGYFTSELVMKDVLKTSVMPGAFNGNAPVELSRRQRG